ncbi:hypothetical protein B0H21DRAFT_257371 [Amylocystis lapponica]|nr:hypothetical protein B0H21DRAFT_257371 [Amylocystis lapponica]
MSCPVNSLPIELLAMIVAWWVDIDEDAVWMASSVCQHWRSIVLENPTVWSCIYINFDPAPPAPPELDETWCIEEDRLPISSPRDKRRPLPLWLERAGNAELRLYIRAHTTSPLLSIALGEMVTTLAPEMARVFHLELSMDSTILAAELFTMLWETAPRLRHLSVLCSEHPLFTEGADFAVLWDALQVAPLIQSLICKGCCPPRSLSNSSVSLRLRSLVFTDVIVSPWTLLNTLRACTNLISLQMSDMRTYILLGSLSLPSPLATFPELVRLVVRRVSVSYFVNFAPYFIAPKLRSFTLENLGFKEVHTELAGGARTYDAMAAFGQAVTTFAIHSPHLQTLALSSSLLPDRHLLEALRRLPHLAELHLDDLFVGAPALRGLTASTSRSPPSASASAHHTAPESPGSRPRRTFVCPQLRHLAVSRCDLLTGRLLVDLVRVRKGSPDAASLQRLDIRRCSKVDATHVDALQRLCDPHLRLSYEPYETST